MCDGRRHAGFVIAGRWTVKLPTQGLAVCLLAAVPVAASAQELHRSGMRLGFAAGLSLNPPPANCHGCVRYLGTGGGVSAHAGWSLFSDMAIDAAATGAMMSFADDTAAFIGIFDVGAVAYRGPNWLRVGTGLARWDIPVPQNTDRERRRWGPGLSVTAGHEWGAGPVKLGIEGALLLSRMDGATLSSLLVLCSLGRS
jgi:hypothetical protein